MEPYDVVIKSVPQIRVVATRVSSDQAIDPLFEEAKEQVSAFAADNNLEATGPLMAIFYEDPTDPDCDCDFAVAFPTDSHVAAQEPIEVLTLPAVDQMAACFFPRSYSADKVDQVYERLMGWIEAHNYRISGPYREILYASEPVIEIQFPIEPFGSATRER